MFEEGLEGMRRRMPDTSKINELIGRRPEKSLDDIIADVVRISEKGKDEFPDVRTPARTAHRSF